MAWFAVGHRSQETHLRDVRHDLLAVAAVGAVQPAVAHHLARPHRPLTRTALGRLLYTHYSVLKSTGTKDMLVLSGV
jgi:hypothetical protein